MDSQRQLPTNASFAISTEICDRQSHAQGQSSFYPHAFGNADTPQSDQSLIFKAHLVPRGLPFLVKDAIQTDGLPTPDVISFDGGGMLLRHTRAISEFKVDHWSLTSINPGQPPWGTVKGKLDVTEWHDEEDAVRDGLSTISGHFDTNTVSHMKIECTEGEHAGRTWLLKVCPCNEDTLQYQTDDEDGAPVLLTRSQNHGDDTWLASRFIKIPLGLNAAFALSEGAAPA